MYVIITLYMYIQKRAKIQHTRVFVCKAWFTIFCLRRVATRSAYKLIWTRIAIQRNAGIEFFSILALQHAFTLTSDHNATQTKIL